MVFLKPAFRWCVLVAVIVAAPRAGRAQAQPTLENDVKAAFLYNFTKFVEWPPPPVPDEPFRVCVIADTGFVATLDRTIADESVGQRRLVRVEPRSIDTARHCAILYIGPGFSDQGAPMLAAVRDLPVLTVGEGAQFVNKQGGAIGFLLEDNRVRFDISVRAIQQSGLKASSKLLRVARSVEGGAQ